MYSPFLKENTIQYTKEKKGKEYYEMYYYLHLSLPVDWNEHFGDSTMESSVMMMQLSKYTFDFVLFYKYNTYVNVRTDNYEK